MSAISRTRPVSQIPATVSEFVVPDDVAASTFVYDPNGGYGPTTFDTFVDAYLTPDLNKMFPGARITRWPSRHGARAIHVVLTTSALLTLAPAAVQTLAAGLAAAAPEAHVIWAQSGGDVWLVGANTAGLRHACFEVMRRLGCRYYLPHPSFTRIPTAPIDISASELRAPVLRDVYFSGNGGLGGYNSHVPARASQLQQANQYWFDWYAQNQCPREWGGTGSGDGDEGFVGFKQCDLRHDRSMMAWVASQSKRGYCSSSVPSVNFPTSCWDYPSNTSVNVLIKLNYTHHGAPGGVYSTAPSNPLIGVIAPVSGCTAIPNVPCSLAADVNPDADSDPFPSEYSSFNGLIRLHCEFHAQVSAARINTYGIGHPFTKWVSVEPQDGGDHCECTKCKNLLRSGPYSAFLTTAQRTQDSSISDRVFHLVNENAKYQKYYYSLATFAPPGVGLLAYHDHAPPPSIPLQPNMLVYFLTEAFGFFTVRTSEELQADWIAKRAANPFGRFTLATQPTWLISSTNVDAPKISPLYTSARAKYWATNGVTAIGSQSTYSSMAMGLHQSIIQRQAWDPSVDVTALVNEFFSVLFGAASTAVQAMFSRFWEPHQGLPLNSANASRWEVSGQEIAQMWADMATAQTALNGSPNAANQTALNHVRAFVWFHQMRLELFVAQAAYAAAVNGTTIANLATAVDNFCTCCAQIQTWNVVQGDRHEYKAWLSLDASSTTIKAKWDYTSTTAAGHIGVTEPTTASLTALVTAGQTAYPLVTGVSHIVFGDTLAPLTSSADPTLVQFPTESNQQTYQFKKGAADVTFVMRQTGNASGAFYPLRVQWQRLDGTVIQEWQTTAVASTTTTYNVTVSGAAGTYLLFVNDVAACNQTMQVQAPRSCPISQVGIISCTRGFDVTTKCWFYVPVGRTRIYMTYVTNSTGVQFYRPDGTTTQATTRHGLYGWYCDIPGGLDGQAWAFTGFYSASPAGVHFENCPSVIAYDPLQLMVPSGLDGH